MPPVARVRQHERRRRRTYREETAPLTTENGGLPTTGSASAGRAGWTANPIATGLPRPARHCAGCAATVLRARRGSAGRNSPRAFRCLALVALAGLTQGDGNRLLLWLAGLHLGFDVRADRLAGRSFLE